MMEKGPCVVNKQVACAPYAINVVDDDDDDTGPGSCWWWRVGRYTRVLDQYSAWWRWRPASLYNLKKKKSKKGVVVSWKGGSGTHGWSVVNLLINLLYFSPCFLLLIRLRWRRIIYPWGKEVAMLEVHSIDGAIALKGRVYLDKEGEG